MQKVVHAIVADCPLNRPAPTLPQAKNNVIDVSLLNQEGDDILVRVCRWDDIAEGDTIVAYFDSTASDPRVIEDISQASYDVPVHTDQIPNGSYEVWYTIRKKIGNCSRSGAQPVTIIGSTASFYPGPLFPEAVNGALTYTSISAWNGTPIQAEYGTIANGDQVTFHWKGFDESGYEVPAAAYTTTPPKTVGETDAANGYVQDQIPLANIQALGDLGYGVAYYEVQPAQGKANQSLNTQVQYTDEDITALQLTVTKQAALQTSDLPHLHPFNTGTVFGAPGAWVTVSVDGGTILEAGQDETTYLTQLVDGFATFRVSSSDKGLITVTVAPQELVGDPSVQNMPFGVYIDGGDTGIQGYNYTTNVPATANLPSGDQVPCYVYFQVNPGLESHGVTVTVDGHAAILGANPGSPQTRTISLYADGSGMAEIIDAVAEKVNVTLSVPGHSGAVQFPHPVDFIEFPSTP